MTTHRITTKPLFRVTVLILAACLAASADSMSLGILSFDLPLGSTSDQFTITNLTGASELPPDFPVTTALIFQNAKLALFGPDAPASPILLGDIDASGKVSGLFADGSRFTSAVFTATLSATTLSVDGGGTETVDSSITTTLSPLSGLFLVAGADFTVIEAAPPSSVPEPSAFVLLVSLAGIVALSTWVRRRVRAETQI